MQIHEVVRKNPNKKKKIVGRGGSRGKTSGRGTKGQNARAGRKKLPEFRTILKKLPKLRGYKFNSITPKPAIITLGDLEKMFEKGAVVTPTALAQLGLRPTQGHALNRVKILTKGTLTKALTIEGCLVSKGAKEAIEKAGGKVQ